MVKIAAHYYLLKVLNFAVQKLFDRMKALDHSVLLAAEQKVGLCRWYHFDLVVRG